MNHGLTVTQQDILERELNRIRENPLKSFLTNLGREYDTQTNSIREEIESSSSSS